MAWKEFMLVKIMEREFVENCEDNFGQTNGRKTVMPKRVTQRLVYSVVFAILLATHPVLAATKPPPKGGTLPQFELPIPEDPETRSYLGLSGSGNFTIPQIKAQAVIVQIFSMY